LRRSLGSQLGVGPRSGRSWRPRLGNHMLALTDWSSQAGTFRRHVPGAALNWPPQSGGGPDWTLWRWSSSFTGGGSREATLAGGPVRVTSPPTFGGWPRLDRSRGGPDWTSRRSPPSGHRRRLSRGAPFGSQLGGWPQPGRSRRPPLGNHMLALSDWHTRTNMCRRHVPGTRSGSTRSGSTRSGGGPHWGPASGRWPRLDPVEVDLVVHRRRLSRDGSRGWPHWGHRLGVAPTGPLAATSPWQSDVGALRLAHSDGHVPETRSRVPFQRETFRGWP
jgi:hypothetical protein